MAKFTFGKTVDIHWNGYEIVGPALTEFTIPDQLYEEFEGDFRDVEPSLTWIDTNEFATLSASVSGSTLSATSPISITTTSTGRNISFSSGTALNGYLLAADGSGGSIWNPASTSGISSVVGVSPISSIISGGVVSVSLDTTATLNATNAGTLRTYVKNASGSTITKGSVVYITGADGTNALIGLASNTSDATSSKTLGIVANTMTNNEFGYVIENGQLSNIDTSAATAGSGVWLGSTPGSYQFTVPSEPNHAVYLGVVTKANASTGEILVKVQNGYEIDELHDVSADTPTDLDILQYKSSSGMWTKSSLNAAGIVTTNDTQTLTNKTLTLPSISNTTGDYATNVQAAATTYTLTSTSPRYQFLTGSQTGTVILLPSTATLVVGQWFEIHNNGGQQSNVSTSTAASVATLSSGISYRVTCISTANNLATAWDVEVIGSATATGTGSSVFSASPTLSGTVNMAAASMTGGLTGVTYIRTAGWTNITTSAGTVALSITGNHYVKFTGTNTHFVTLTASGTAGLEYTILNTSTGDVTIRSSNLSTVVVLKQNQAVKVMLNTTSGTLPTSWDVEWLGASTSTGTGSTVYSASPTLTGDVTLNAQGDIRFADSDSSNWVALQGPATVASNVTWTLPSADGASGQALTTNGTGTLSWSSPTSSYNVNSSGSISGSSITVAQESPYIVMNTTVSRPTRIQQDLVTSTLDSSPIFINNKSSLTVSMPIGWTWLSTNIGQDGSTVQINNIKYKNSAFYLLWNNGNLSRSTDGATFTLQTAAGSAALKDMDSDGTTMVVCGNAGLIISSANGTAWTARTSNAGADNLDGIAYGASTFVAVGNAGRAITSSDGVTWTSRTSGFGVNNIVDVVFGASLFVAYSISAIRTSPDGITWTSRTVPAGFSGNMTRSAFENGVFVIGSNNGEIMTSTDGITWTEVTSPNASTVSGLEYLGSSRWINSGNNGTLYYSFDNAATWSTIQPFNNAQLAIASLDNMRMAFGNNRLIAVNSDNTSQAAVYSTTTSPFSFAMIGITSVTV